MTNNCNDAKMISVQSKNWAIKYLMDIKQSQYFFTWAVTDFTFMPLKNNVLNNLNTRQNLSVSVL